MRHVDTFVRTHALWSTLGSYVTMCVNMFQNSCGNRQHRNNRLGRYGCDAIYKAINWNYRAGFYKNVTCFVFGVSVLTRTLLMVKFTSRDLQDNWYSKRRWSFRLYIVCDRMLSHRESVKKRFLYWFGKSGLHLHISHGPALSFLLSSRFHDPHQTNRPLTCDTE